MVRAVAHAMANADIRTVGVMRRVTRVEVGIVDEGEGEERTVWRWWMGLGLVMQG